MPVDPKPPYIHAHARIFYVLLRKHIEVTPRVCKPNKMRTMTILSYYIFSP